MVSAATRRKKRERGNRVANDIEDGRRFSAAEKKLIGTSLGPKVPNSVLFQVDRKGHEKVDLKTSSVFKSREGRLEAKRAARANPRPRKSEFAAEAPGDMDVDAEISVPTHGKKKKRDTGLVDDQILRKRFLKGSKEDKETGDNSGKPLNSDGEDDVWTSKLAEQVQSQISDRRRRLVKKASRRLRRAPAVIYPDAGISVNPAYEHHQDKLGEAVAAVISEQDNDRWNDQMLSYDPAILEESRAGEFGDTGMKTADIEDLPDEDDDLITTKNPVPERKTRKERNKEKRKRELASNIRKKRRDARQTADILNLDAIAVEAQAEADKLNGVTKKRLRRQHVHVVRRPTRPVRKRIAGRRVRTEAVAEPFALSEELSENMRSVQLPMNNPMLQERLLSFERRGMVEPPKVISTEIWRMEQERRRKENTDTRKRKGKHSKSDISYWKEKSRK